MQNNDKANEPEPMVCIGKMHDSCILTV